MNPFVSEEAFIHNKGQKDYNRSQKIIFEPFQ